MCTYKVLNLVRVLKMIHNTINVDYEYLKVVDPKQLPITYFSIFYNLITSNNVESINMISRDARNMSLMMLKVFF